MTNKNISNNFKEIQTDSGHQFLAVKGIKWYTSSIFELSITRGDIEFSPGDCLSIFDQEGKISRPYSIASGINENELTFLIRHMDEGVVTDYLKKTIPGDIVRVSMPYGWFRPGQEIEENNRFIFIATGTGIAPFLSYCKSFPNQPPEKILYGVRTYQEAVGYQFLKKTCPIELAISREKISGFHLGRVTDLLPGLSLSYESHYFLCGLDLMINTVTDWLESKGVPSHYIHQEVFFHAT